MKLPFILLPLVVVVAGQGSTNLSNQTLGRSNRNRRFPFAAQMPSMANLPPPGTIKDFADFVNKTGRVYGSRPERALRESVFNMRQSSVDSTNDLFRSRRILFETGLNFFSDLKGEEVVRSLCGRKKTTKGESMVTHRKASTHPEGDIPDSFDWREKGGVTPVKFQGLGCGACWSFAVTGSIEGHVFRKTGKLVSLSEQQLVDCATHYGTTGCGGGFHDYAFQYVLKNKGISKEELYPYEEMDGKKCRYDPKNVGATIRGYATIPPGNETMIKHVVAILGPVAASVFATDSFQLYKGGIYDDDECNKEEVNHEILIIGYGSEDNRDYWIIKNQWGDKWGENGYMKLLRNAKSFCSIASEASYPLI